MNYFTCRFDDALEDAKKVDDILSKSDIPDQYSEKNAPFLGVPFTAKEAFAVTGTDSFPFEQPVRWSNKVVSKTAALDSLPQDSRTRPGCCGGRP